MKKMFAMLMVIAAIMFMAQGAVGADLQDSHLATTAAITTNSLSAEIAAVGEIKCMTIDVSNANPFALTIADQATGAIIYTNGAIAADITLIPRLANTGSTGATLTYLSAAGVTNIIYSPVNCIGLRVTAVGSSNTANTVGIKVITDKNP
jgi:hypothetical protein